MVKSDFKELERQFSAHLDELAFEGLFAMREKDLDLKIPLGMEYSFASNKKIQKSIKSFNSAFESKCRQQIDDIDAELKEIEQKLKIKVTKTWEAKFASKNRQREKLLQKIEKATDEFEGNKFRIYPMYFAPVIVSENGKRIIRPMRYRVLPKSGVEIPAKYNLFNARRNTLNEAKTWKELFGKQHALFPFDRFYEWVQGKNGKPHELYFSPDGFEGMWASSLYSETQTPNGLLRSFAMVTDDPPPEVKAAGHDRCPIFLEHSLIEAWLNPKGKSLKELDQLLGHKEKTYFSNSLAA